MFLFCTSLLHTTLLLCYFLKYVNLKRIYVASFYRYEHHNITLHLCIFNVRFKFDIKYSVCKSVTYCYKLKKKLNAQTLQKNNSLFYEFYHNIIINCLCHNKQIKFELTIKSVSLKVYSFVG